MPYGASKPRRGWVVDRGCCDLRAVHNRYPNYNLPSRPQPDHLSSLMIVAHPAPLFFSAHQTCHGGRAAIGAKNSSGSKSEAWTLTSSPDP